MNKVPLWVVEKEFEILEGWHREVAFGPKDDRANVRED